MNDAGPKSVKEAELLDLRQSKFFGSKALCRFSILDKACVSPSQEAYAAKANGLGWCDCEFARLKRTHVSSKLHQQENSERQLGLRPGKKKLAIACHFEINETEFALPHSDRCPLYYGFYCWQEPTILLSPSQLAASGEAASPIQHRASEGIRFTSSTTCTLLG